MEPVPTPEVATPADGSPAAPTPRVLFLAFLSLGAAAFRGTAVVAHIRALVVARRRWLSAEDHAEGAALCELVPGANGLQSAAWVGWRLAGLPGALAAAGGFILPAAAAMLALSLGYVELRRLPAAAPALAGLRVSAVALLAHGALSSGRLTVRSLGGGVLVVIGALAFLAGLGPFQTVVTASLLAALVVPPRPPAGPLPAPPVVIGRRELLPPAHILLAASVLLAVAFLVDRRLDEVGFAMAKVEWLSFGGAFGAVPPLVQEGIKVKGWVDSGGFLDGLALALVTPGPTALVAGFLGLQAAGLLGALVGMIGVFVPTLLILLVAEPWSARVRAEATLAAGMDGARAAVVGMLLAVTVQLGRAGVTWTPRTEALGAAVFLAALLGARPAWIIPVAVAASAWLG
jgi:chromate transporter